MLNGQAILAAGWGPIDSEWLVAGAIILLGLVLYGGKDLLRLSLVRIRAVASVCFRESIRRRVLWLVPLAVVGVILVSQFQRPLDEQDAVRQATKFCLFTAGMLVTMASIILGCTSIPREIDNRVIYTIVTKPTSRLEILLGKIAGFAGISAAILLIMGLFTWGYVSIQEWTVSKAVEQRLRAGNLEPATENILKYYSQYGLLDAREFATTPDIQVYSPGDVPGSGARWIASGANEAMVPFDLSDAFPPNTVVESAAIAVRMPWERRKLAEDESKQLLAVAESVGAKSTDAAAVPGMFGLYVAGPDLFPVVERGLLHGEKPVLLPDPAGQGTALVPLADGVLQQLASVRWFYVVIDPGATGTRYKVDKSSAALLIKVAGKDQPMVIPSRKFDPRYVSDVLTVGRVTQNGQQLSRPAEGEAPTAVLSFRGREVPQFAPGVLGFEMRAVLERGGDSSDALAPTFIEAQLVDTKSGRKSEPVKVALESRRTSHFTIPSSVLTSDDFSVNIRLLTRSQWVNFRPHSLRLAGPDEGFGLNLAKSLLILWMFSILTITIAIFCSTFLSWPIALVLTLVILLGHWGVGQLGDFAAPGVGRQIVNDLFSGTAPAVAETLNRSVEGLSSLTRTVASVLPDISQFAAMADIEQGVAISYKTLGAGLRVLGVFGLSILSLSYVFFRNKEVAP